MLRLTDLSVYPASPESTMAFSLHHVRTLFEVMCVGVTEAEIALRHEHGRNVQTRLDPPERAGQATPSSTRQQHPSALQGQRFRVPMSPGQNASPVASAHWESAHGCPAGTGC